MLTAEQIKLLEDLGFKLFDVDYYYQKHYRVKGIISVTRNINSIIGKHTYIAHMVDTCKEAQSDLAKLREGGIV